jgi:hypothetical protein
MTVSDPFPVEALVRGTSRTSPLIRRAGRWLGLLAVCVQLLMPVLHAMPAGEDDALWLASLHGEFCGQSLSLEAAGADNTDPQAGHEMPACDCITCKLLQAVVPPAGLPASAEAEVSILRTTGSLALPSLSTVHGRPPVRAPPAV